MEDNTGRRQSSRRAVSSSKEKRKSALEELKNARLSGKVYRRNTDNLVQDIYSEVTDEEYAKIQKQRAFENIVEDDDGTGYYDDGTVDDFDEYDEDEYDQPSSSKAKSKSRKDDKKQKKGSLYNFFAVNVKSNEKASEDEPCNMEEDPDMLSMLEQLDQSYADCGAENPAFNFGKNNFAEPVVDQSQTGAAFSWPSENPFNEPAFEPTNFQPIESFPIDVTMGTDRNLSRMVDFDRVLQAGSSRKRRIDDSDDSPSDSDAGQNKSIKRPAPISPSQVPAPKMLKLPKKKKHVMDKEDKMVAAEKELEKPVVVPEIEPVAATESELPDQTPLFSDQQFERIDHFETEEMEEEQAETNEQPNDANVLRMYWTETFEDVYKNPGSVYLFGKVDGQSCCVIVRNIEHKVFFLPRKLDGDSDQNLAEVREEVAEKFKNNQFFKTSDAKDKVFQSSYETIKWIPTDEKVPREVRALMVLYKGRLPKMSLNATGNTFSHVLNTTATAMERLLLEAKLRGPCWIDISNAVKSKKDLSHCKLEYVVNMKTADNYNIKTAPIVKPSPFVNLLALNIVGVPSSSGKETELIMISGLYRNKGVLDRANHRSQQSYETFCFMTNPKKGAMPLSFDAQLKNAKINPDSVKKFPNERVLLNSFFAKLKQLDPDIFILHDASAQLLLLALRAEKYSIKTWSFISRLNQSQTPSRLCKTKTGQWELVAGRSVLCSKTASEELYPTKSYELGDLVTLLIPKASHVQLTFAQIIEIFTSHNPALSVSQLIQWSWLEAYFSLLIVLQLNALPLFVQITQIVGGVLSRTLLGGRSERNEYLLLHAFYEAGYIPPDKHQFAGSKKGNKALKDETNADDDDVKAGAGRKAQYTGGLVLEPRKGFYDSYIVLLDFNSLYPSIIQEFNICFTTIDRCYEEPDEKGLPEPPKDSVPEGILSIEIGNLVRNRREVKIQMQRAKPGTDEYMRLDVRQKGLKLTANSMYGCLGFGMSRFCAKTLAAMITFKGRELLSRTKDVVEKRGYTVVYGDTDSIMVNTNTAVYGDACRLAFDLRKIVNGGFKHVEMDVDGLFKRLLLLKKKKYAALTVSLKSETAVKKEMKGLDIVRRDWSKLAKDVGERVVDLILNSKEREELVNEVVDTLNELAMSLKENKLPMEDFEILKQLTKAPRDYVDIKNQPHVMVAQRLNTNQGFHLRQGDVIKYVICQDGTSNSAVQRAYHLSELAINKDWKIDSYYYLSQQVHPVVMRLCEPFNELDSGRIAEALGLDPVGYRSHATNKSADFGSFDFVTDASSDFDLCEGFKFECPQCKKLVVIRSAFSGQGSSMDLSLEKCPECQCKFVEHCENLKSELLVQLNSFIRKYLTARFVCDDQTCAYQENDPIGLTWTSSQGPLCPQCKSTFMRKEFSLRDLFYQQKFFSEHIFNLRDQKLWHDRKGPFAVQIYDDCKKLAIEHMNANRYNRVNLGRVLGGFQRKL